MSSSDFDRVLLEVTAAECYRDLFDTTANDEAGKRRDIKQAYRRRAMHIHPDRVAAWDKDVAAEAFRRLTMFYDEANKVVAEQSGTGPKAPGTVMKTATATHAIKSDVLEWADMTDCYRATTTIGGRSVDSFLKIARVQEDNELVGAEAEAVRRLLSGSDAKRTVYYPKLLDTFGVSIGGVKLRANVFGFLEGFVNLAEVHRVRPNGLHPLDAAWMWRRLLWALDYVHQQGVVHGAVLPQNVMILPEQHGLVLVDWSYSIQRRTTGYWPLRAIVGDRRQFYPLQALAKEPVSCATDITMAARSFVYVMGGSPETGALPTDVPALMRDHFKELANHGASDVASIAIRYDELLLRLGSPYYPRTFRPFKL